MFCNWFGNLEERIKKLEAWAHPPRGLHELDDYKALDDRIKKLEENSERKKWHEYQEFCT